MWKDPIVEETRELRDAYASQFNYDIDAIFEDLLKRQAAHPERVVRFPPRRAMSQLNINAASTEQTPSVSAASRNV
jgi:hypothetical protein